MSKITLESLQNQVKDMSSSGGGNFARSAFLPEGNHTVRFLTDPDGQMSAEYYTFGYFNKGIRDPKSLSAAELPEGFNKENHPLKVIADQASEHNIFKLLPKYNFLVYLYLIDTDNPDKDNWVAGSLYCIIGNGKLGKAYKTFVETMSKNSPDSLIKTLSPEDKGVNLLVSFTSGTQGACTIAPVYPAVESDPIENFGEFGYEPLETAYIKPGFNQEKYDALVIDNQSFLNGKIASLEVYAKKQQETAAKEPDTAEVKVETKAVEVKAETKAVEVKAETKATETKAETKATETKAETKATETKVDTTEVKVDTTEVKVDTTETKVDTTEVKVDTTETKVDTTEVKVDTTETKVDTTEVKVGVDDPFAKYKS